MKRRFTFLFAVAILIIILTAVLSGCGTSKVVTFLSNGGSAVGSQTVSGNYAVEPQPPVRQGYQFLGWELRGEPFDFNTAITESITLVAKWSAIEYNVIFENCEGVTVPGSSFTVEDGSYALPTELTREGYKFSGWYKDAELTLPITEIDTSVCADVTVYAKWLSGPFTVEYLNWPNPDPDAPASYNVGDTVILPVPKREHYVFIGWHPGSIGNPIITELDTSAAQNIKLYAEWRAIEYTITYINCDGAVNSLPTSYTVIKSDISLTPISKDHYNFLGWYTDEELTENITEIDCSLGGNITLYASFEFAPHTYENEWSCDESKHWHASTCNHPDEVLGEGAHILSGGVCTVCGYDDGLRIIRELIESAALSSSVVTTSVDTGLASEPMSGEYVLTFNPDGTISVIYSYEVFTDSEDWIETDSPYKTVNGSASVDEYGNLTGNVTVRIINTGTLGFNLTRENSVSVTQGNTVTVTVGAQNTESCLGFKCASAVTMEFSISCGKIDTLSLSFTENMSNAKVPVTITANFTYL